MTHAERLEMAAMLRSRAAHSPATPKAPPMPSDRTMTVIVAATTTAGVALIIAASLAVTTTTLVPEQVTLKGDRESFSEHWRDSAVPLGFKIHEAHNAPKQVQTLRIAPDANAPVEWTPPAPDAPTTPAQIRPPRPRKASQAIPPVDNGDSAQRDVCRGKGKKTTHGGRSWRCRR